MVVEAVPWSDGKHPLTRALCCFWPAGPGSSPGKKPLKRFTRRGTTVCHAVKYVVGWGLAHRTLAPIRAIGVDEIQPGQRPPIPDAGLPRRSRGHPPALGRAQRLKASFEGFFTLIGPTLASEIAFV